MMESRCSLALCQVMENAWYLHTIPYGQGDSLSWCDPGSARRRQIVLVQLDSDRSNDWEVWQADNAGERGFALEEVQYRN